MNHIPTTYRLPQVCEYQCLRPPMQKKKKTKTKKAYMCEILWEKSPLKLYMPTNTSPTDEDQVAGISLQLPRPPLPHKWF